MMSVFKNSKLLFVLGVLAATTVFWGYVSAGPHPENFGYCTVSITNSSDRTQYYWIDIWGQWYNQYEANVKTGNIEAGKNVVVSLGSFSLHKRVIIKYNWFNSTGGCKSSEKLGIGAINFNIP